MALERCITRVSEWLARSVATVPASGLDTDGPAVTLEAYSERKRTEGQRLAVVSLEGASSSDAAGQIVEACVNACVDIPARGTSFYLYACNARGRAVLAAFPILVKPGDLGPGELASTAAASSSPSSPSSPSSLDITGMMNGASVLLRGERAYSTELQRMNLDTLAGAAGVMERAAKLHETALEITLEQSKGLLEQLRAANECRTAAETRARELELQLRDKDKALRDALELCETIANQLEARELEHANAEHGPMAVLKKQLLEKLATGFAGEVFGTEQPPKPYGNA